MGELSLIEQRVADGTLNVGDIKTLMREAAISIRDKCSLIEELHERNRELTRQVEQLQAKVDAAGKLANQWAITRDYMMNQCSKSLRAALTAPPSSSDPGRADTGREER